MRADHFKSLALAVSLLGLALGATDARAALSLGPGGLGPLTFDATPVATEFSTGVLLGTGPTFNSVATMDAGAQTVNAANVVRTLPTSGTEPPSLYSGGFRRHTVRNALMSRPTTEATNAASIMVATLQNDSGVDQPTLVLAYDFDLQSPAATATELRGYYVYYSFTGLPNTWVPIPGLTGSEVVGGMSDTLSLGSWPPGNPLYILWADDNADGATDPSYTMDNMLFTFGGPVPPPVITDSSSLTNQTVLQCRAAATLSVTASGVGNTYQWYRDGNPIPGATARTYAIPNMQAADVGDYFVRVTNAGGSVDSQPPAHLDYVADTIPPTIVYAICNTNLTEITLSFSEPVNTTAPYLAAIPSTYALTDATAGAAVGILGATAPNASTIVLSTPSLNPLHRHMLHVVHEDACAANVLDTTVAVSMIPHTLVDLDAGTMWSYLPGEVDLGAGAFVRSYDDSAWPLGPAPFDTKRAAAADPQPHCRPTIPTNNEPVLTCLSLSNAANTAQLSVYYFRKHFTFSGNPAETALRLVTLLDDGAVFYLNGVELTRIGIGAGPVTFGFGGAPGLRTITDAYFETTDVAAPTLITGDNVIAAQLRQVSATSSDSTFALKLIALDATPPLLVTVVLNPDGSVTLTWPGTGTLICTDDPTLPRAGWTPVVGATSPHTIPAAIQAPHRFYSVREP